MFRQIEGQFSDWSLKMWSLHLIMLSVYKISYYRGADKSLARPTSWYILFDGGNISFVAGLVIYVNSNNIPLIMIINKICEHQNLLSL